MKTKQGYFDPKMPRALDDRHYKATQAEILAIPEGARYEGMEIFAYTEGTWYQFQGGVTDLDLVESRPAAPVQEAPEDGSRYGRKDAGWEVDPIQSDAPADGEKYGRKDNAWEAITEGGLAYGIWYVDENYAGGSDDGSPQKPFSTSTGVNNAIAAASDGDVIMLAPGSYLIFGATNKNLTFIGYGSNTDANNGTELLSFGDVADTSANAVRHRFVRLALASITFSGGNAYNVEFFDVKEASSPISVTCTDFQADACYLDMDINAATVDIRNTRFLYNSIIGGTGIYRLTNVHLGYSSTGNPGILEDVTTTGTMYLENCTLGANIACNFLHNKASQWTGKLTGTIFPGEDFGPQPRFFSAGSPTISAGVADLDYGGRLVTVNAETGTTDDLDSITGLTPGDMIVLFAGAGDTITVKHANGGVNPDILLAKGADYALSGNDLLLLFYTGAGGAIYEIANTNVGSVSPLTTKGDLYTYDTGNQRLPVGADGQVLSSDSAESTGLKWVNPGAASVPVDTTIWYVLASGNDVNGGHLPGDALLTLQEAVTQAASDDTIFVGASLGSDLATIPTTKDLTFIGIPNKTINSLPRIRLTVDINTDVRIQGCSGDFGGVIPYLTGTELILEQCDNFEIDDGAADIKILNCYDITLGNIQVGNLIINSARLFGFNTVDLTGVSCYVQDAVFESNEGDWILNGAITVNFYNTVINLSSISGDGVGGNATVVLWNSSFSRGDMATTTNLDVVYRNQAPSFGSNLHYMENISVPTGTGNVVNTESVQNINLQVTGGTTAEIIEFTGGVEGSELIVRPNTGHTITLKHDDAGATNKIILSDATDRVLSDVNDVVRLFVLPDGTFKELGVAGSGGGGGPEYARWYVDPNYAGGSNDGSPQKPYTAIQDAVTAAVEGDTIICAGGLYITGATINKGLTIIGAGRSGQNTQTTSYFASQFLIDTTAGDIHFHMRGFAVFNGATPVITESAGANVSYAYVHDCDMTINGLVVDNLYVYSTKIGSSTITGNTLVELHNSQMATDHAIVGGAVNFFDSHTVGDITATGTVDLRNSYVGGDVSAAAQLVYQRNTVVVGTITSAVTAVENQASPKEVRQSLTVTNANYTAALALDADANVIEITLDAALTNNWQPSGITGWVVGRTYVFEIIKASSNSIDLTTARAVPNVGYDDDINPFTVLDSITTTQGRAVITAIGFKSTFGQFGRMIMTDTGYAE